MAAGRADVAPFVRELMERPHRRGANVVSIDPGAGLSNATVQQRLVPVRLFYDFLVEEGIRTSNPVGRGRYTPSRHHGSARLRPGTPVHEAAVDPERGTVVGRADGRRR